MRTVGNVDGPSSPSCTNNGNCKDQSISECRLEERLIPRKVDPMAETFNSWIGTKIGKYLISSFIANGTEGFVFLVVDQIANKRYAMKICEKDSLRNRDLSSKGVPLEVEILRSIEHPNIIQYQDYKSSKKFAFLFMEYATQGAAITSFLLASQSEGTVSQLMKPVLTALKFLHSKGIVHLDLKLDNLLQTSATTLKLADFGHAEKLIRRGKTLHGRRGTPPYCAPEMIVADNYDGELADAFSLGVCLHAMITQKFPLFRGEKLVIPNPPPSENAVELLSKLLCPNPEKRMNLSELISHQWFGK